MRSFVLAADVGAPGGTPDDTASLLKAMAAVPDGTTIVLSDVVYSIQADAIQHNRDGLRFASLGVGHSLGPMTGPVIRLLNGGVWGLKLGDAGDYPAGLKFSNGLSGIRLDFNGKTFTDAGLVIEGQTKLLFRDTGVFNCGTQAAPCRAVRMRVVWDSLVDNLFVSRCSAEGSSVLYFDAQADDANGNCNNIRFVHGHWERNSGTWIASHPDSNIDVIKFTHSKFEWGGLVGFKGAYLFDLDGAHRCEISENGINLFNAAQFAALCRFGATSWSTANRWQRNTYTQIATTEVIAGPNASLTKIGDNLIDNGPNLSSVNQGAHKWLYEPAENG